MAAARPFLTLASKRPGVFGVIDTRSFFFMPNPALSGVGLVVLAGSGWRLLVAKDTTAEEEDGKMGITFVAFWGPSG